MDKSCPTPSQIADYALIGDCESAALVDRHGSIDWLCWPRFDSDACFAALLGDQSNGFWRVAPTGEYRCSRRYRQGTLILETLFETDTGQVLLTDFMPPRAKISHIVRLVECRSGRVDMRMDMRLRFGYGVTVPWVTRFEEGGISAIAGPRMAILRTPAPMYGEHMSTVSQFTLSEGEQTYFVLTDQASHLPPPPPIDPLAALEASEDFWSDWLGKGQFGGPYADAIARSLITLKALTFAPTGGLVAAPTTSLPEQFGGERNWDYRFCWIRDSTITLMTMMNAGYYEEAAAWRDWLQRAVAGDPADMQIMYGLGGERRLTEWTADWLAGHANSKPVRIGNAAHKQFQLDVYGELMDTFQQARLGGLETTAAGWDLQCALIDHLAKVWSDPDEGIWEVRGPRQHFTFSRMMAWVAVDRAIKGIEDFGLHGPLDDWRALRDQIKADVWASGFDREAGRFKRSYEDAGLDASLLLMAPVGFIEPSDPAYIATVEAIERELLVDGFVLRYQTSQTDDGLPPGEAAFLACSFWLADAYAMIGREDDATALFERLLAIRNDLGLLAEEYDAKAGRFAGNYPQAFSHIGLINTAFNLTHSSKPSEQRSAPG